jgi:allophanate hydrolase
MKIAVVGAHLSGLPLNGQLTELGATLVRAGRTKPVYRLYALPNTNPAKPGMLRASGPTGGPGIELEVWETSAEAFGRFVAAVPPPLAIGTIELEDGDWVKGFLVESYAVDGAREITKFGGWRRYLAEANQKSPPAT